jgi:hypothetical protein
MASTDLERRLVLVWPILLTEWMDMQVDGKYRLGKKIGSGSFGGHLQCSYLLTLTNIWLGTSGWDIHFGISTRYSVGTVLLWFEDGDQ